MTNINIRVLGNGHIFVQYHKEGKAYDAGFVSWAVFIEWLTNEVVAWRAQ